MAFGISTSLSPLWAISLVRAARTATLLSMISASFTEIVIRTLTSWMSLSFSAIVTLFSYRGVFLAALSKFITSTKVYTLPYAQKNSRRRWLVTAFTLLFSIPSTLFWHRALTFSLLSGTLPSSSETHHRLFLWPMKKEGSIRRTLTAISDRSSVRL